LHVPSEHEQIGVTPHEVENLRLGLFRIEHRV
jgi:hypothetical protein